MAARPAQALEDLAEELTRRLTIPFHADANGTITFRDRLRVTDWAVPLIFDGHAARDRDALIPLDFVGHALWPTLHATRRAAAEQPWWRCTMPAAVARAIVESLADEDEHPLDEGVWKIGLDVLLEGAAATTPVPAHRPATAARRRRAAA